MKTVKPMETLKDDQFKLTCESCDSQDDSVLERTTQDRCAFTLCDACAPEFANILKK